MNKGRRRGEREKNFYVQFGNGREKYTKNENKKEKKIKKRFNLLETFLFLPLYSSVLCTGVM